MFSLRRWVPGPVKSVLRRVKLAPSTVTTDPRLWHTHGFKWALEQVLTNSAGLAAHAWFIAPKKDSAYLVLGVNGVPFPAQERIPRPDVAAVTPALKDFSHYEAVGVIGNGWDPPGEVRPGGWYKLEILDRRTGKPYPGVTPAAWCRLSTPGDPPCPNAVLRQRVHGSDRDDTYLAIGAMVFGQLRETLRRATQKDIAAFPRVLDWGCGNGRVTRYFREFPVAVTGVDVDPDGIRWCRDNLGFGKFETIPLHPPSGLPAASFDLAIGVSIFTHLKEDVQHEWLAELARIVHPGGILLMSYHGNSAIATTRLTPAQMASIRKYGFLDLANRQYDANLAETDYYRNTFHSADYIRRVWGRYFEILDLAAGALFVQDVAVMRRR
jgi:SAM-dependent methyltransferase